MQVDEVREDWQRADYILRGSYCPLNEVRAQLERVRARFHAEVLVHIALDHDVIIRSLSWVVGDDPELWKNLSQRLRMADYRNRNRKTNNLFVQVARDNATRSISWITPDVADELLTSIEQIRPRTLNGRKLPESKLPGTHWNGIVLNHTGRDGTAPRDGEVRSVLLFHPPAPRELVNEGLLQDLGVKLKCTLVANTRRDAVVMNQVAEQLSTVSSVGHSTFDEAAGDALALAREITDSVAGAVYLLSTHDTTTFARVAVHTNDGEFDYPEHIPVDNSTTVGWSIARHQAYQDVGDDMIARRQRAVQTNRRTDGTELVTPIAGQLANTLQPAIGAVVLFQAQGSQGYGAYERALVRNVALRLALMRTTMATRDIATAISALRSGSPRRWHPERKLDAERADGVDLPRDLRRAVRKFDTPLQKLAASTQSHSVSLRIALPHQTDAVHGLALTRIAAYPATRISELFAVQTEGNPGPHWDVMRSGAEIYVRDTTVDSRYAEVRPGTKSALCVPVRMEGILAGTLNLESPLIDNYATYMPIVVALCGAVGRTLADARAELEDRVLEKAAVALAKRHEFMTDLKSLREDLEKILPPAAEETILSRVDAMDLRIQDLREPEYRGPAAPISLWQAFKDSLKETQLRIPALSRPKHSLFSRPLDPRASQAICTMFRSVLQNISKHSDVTAFDFQGKRVPRVSFSATQLQGTQQAVVVLENLSRNYVDDHFCRELYRYPVEGSGGELRLGTYIAGLNARRVGARIHAQALNDKRIFRTTIIIPVEALQ